MLTHIHTYTHTYIQTTKAYLPYKLNTEPFGSGELKCKHPDFKFYLSKLIIKFFSIWCDVNFGSVFIFFFFFFFFYLFFKQWEKKIKLTLYLVGKFLLVNLPR